MKESTQRIIDLMNQMAADVRNRTKTPAESKNYFLQQVSQKQLEHCLVDESLDERDIKSVKQMLKIFFNHELQVV
jgi:hypothetical protein